MKEMSNAVFLILCCLLITGCSQKNGKWLMFGVEVATESRIQPKSMETFVECLNRNKSVSATQLKRLFDKEVALVRKHKSAADWGTLACLAFNDSATVFQVKSASLLLPNEELSFEEKRLIGIIKELLSRRAMTLGKLGNLERQLSKNMDFMKTLKNQVEKLQEIEVLLETK